MSITKVGLTSLAAALISFAFAANSQAASATGYLCNVTYSPNTTYGTYGGFFVNVMTQANCGGSPLANVAFCSTSATSSTCDTTYLYREAALMALVQTATSAAQLNQIVVVNFTTGTGKGQNIVFVPNLNPF